MTQQLFVYGSLRSGFRNPAYEYLTRYFTLVGEAMVNGKLYDNGSYPVAISSNNEHDFINGELYAIKNEGEFSWAIEQLDDYEGLNVEADEQIMYKRERVQVYLQNHTTAAWIYWYNGDVMGMADVPSGDLLQYLQQKNNP